MRSKIRIIAWLMLLLGFAIESKAQSFEIQQLLLNAEKLTQFKSILSDMKKGYQTLSSGYQLVKNVSKGNFSLHETFLSGLMLVSPEVRKYHKIKDILALQAGILKEYKSAYRRFVSSGNFGPDDLGYLDRVYSQLFSQSLRHLDELTLVITSVKLRMSDDERLSSIDRIFDSMQEKMVFLRDFNQRTAILSIQRGREINNMQQLQKLHGTN